MRRMHRHLPGGRADQRHLSLSDAPLGNGARRHHLHPLLGRMPYDARRAQRENHPRQQSRPQRHQRRVSVHQRPLRFRFRRTSGPPSITHDAGWRQLRADLLVEGDRSYQRTFLEYQRPQRQFRDHRIESHHQRRKLLPGETRAPGPGNQEHRSSSHRRSGDVLRRSFRPQRRSGDNGRSVQRQGRADRRQRPFAAASFARVPGARECPASLGAHLYRDVRSGPRR